MGLGCQRGLARPAGAHPFAAIADVLFALYHLHEPWVIPQALLDTFIVAYPSKRYRSALIGIIVHSAQSIVFVTLTLAVVVT